ncbi:MAG: M1 family metallopeptidase [Anaerolineae bacterium]
MFGKPLRPLLFALAALLIASCALQIAAPPSSPLLPTADGRPPTADRRPPTVTMATATVVPTAVASPTSAPTTATAATPTIAPTPTPAPAPVNWDIYAAALRPAIIQQLAPDIQPGGRLSHLTQYSITVTLDAGLKWVSGRQIVRYTNTERVPLEEIYFHLFPNLWDGHMSVSAVAVDGRPTEAALESGDDLLRVPLGRRLEPGRWVEIALDFWVPIPADTEVGNYGEFALVDGILAMAHFYPTVVVYDEQGWHTETPALQGDVIFHDASLYDVSLTAPANLVVAATGATIARRENGDGTATWHLAGGPMRDFNIVASARYQVASRQVGDITVNSYHLPEDAAGGQKALNWAALALETYQQQFGPYPYRELDVAATMTTAGGIEYPGLIVVARRLYYDPNNILYFESVTIHEVAHQWWYNVVGNDQVTHPWLDEALTQYSTYFYYEKFYGAEAIANLMASFRARWSRADYAEKPIGLPVSAYPNKEYSAIVYGRGPLFLIALRDRIGADKMAALLRRYYAEYAWGIATPADFRRLAEEMGGQKLDDLWREWVEP